MRVLIIVGLAHLVLAAGLSISLLRRRLEPLTMLAWLLAIWLIPLLGSFGYVLLGSTRVRRKASRRRRRVADLLRRIEQRADVARASAAVQLPEDLDVVERITQRIAHMPALGGNAIELYDDATATYAALADAIRSAQHHLHVQYYIWQPDDTGKFFRELLIERARAGVEVRLLLDAVGSLALGRRFLAPLREAGVKVAFFLPLYALSRRLTPHLRNHRKCVVVDGGLAMLGSQNIGDEYRGRLAKLSPWYDSHLTVRGPAALMVAQVFAEDWFFATRESLVDEKYFPMQPPRGDHIVQIVPTGPDQEVSALGQVLFAAVATARQSVRLATPYFVPDNGLRLILVHAALRGVRVELVLPTRTDVPVTLWAARSFYPEMLESGVNIYEFDHGVLHSKLVTVDDRWCMLSSANMDARSFQLNFELSALLYSEAATASVAQTIARYRDRSRLITPRDAWQSSLVRQVGEGAARLLAPML